MSKEDWEREREILKASADRIFTVSILLGQIVIWFLVSLLIYSEFILGESVQKNLLKMIIVGAIVIFLIWLSIFSLMRARKRLGNQKKDDGGDD